VDGNGSYKQQHLTELSVAFVLFNIATNHPVQVGYRLVDEVQSQRTDKNTGYGGDDISVFQRRQNQTQNCGCQHDACRKGQDNIAEAVCNFLKNHAQDRADDCRTADPKGGQKNHTHIRTSLFVSFFAL